MDDEQIISYISSNDKPFVTAPEIADVAGIARQNAYRKLQRLHDEGRIEKYKVGSSAVIWWVPEP